MANRERVGREERGRTHRLLSEVWRSWLSCGSRAAPEKRSRHRFPWHGRSPENLSRIGCGPRSGCKTSYRARSALPRHPARSQVPDQDNDGRSAHRPQREPGGRGNCSRLCHHSARGPTGQHAVGRHRRDLAVSCRGRVNQSTNAVVSSIGIHARQSSRVRGRSAQLFFECPGRRQVRRHSCSGALFGGRGEDILPDSRRDHRILPRVGRRSFRVAARRDSGR